jgi:DNA polymerase I-like protein with 3'-5' exonuclease and polymerase domains
VGVSIATDDFSGYYPIRHEGGGNLPAETVLRWLRDQLAGSEPKVGARFSYDLGWLSSEGIQVGGPKFDVQIADALLDENQDSYELDVLIKKYGGEGKDESLLRSAAASMGWRTDKQVKSNLWRLHSRFVGPYAEGDATGTLLVHRSQQPLIQADDLSGVYKLESRLIDVLHKTRRRGIPIDVGRAERAITSLRQEHQQCLDKLRTISGCAVDVWSANSIASAFDLLGIPYPRTEKGNPSFVAEWLEAHPTDFARTIVLARQLDRAGEVFIKSKILGLAVNGRLHPNYKQTRVDDGGTRSGRLSSSNPNFQQFPARNPILAKAIRSCLVPDDGYYWGVFDYSQQEPRVTVHYAYLRGMRGAEAVVKEYRANPRTDYHQAVADLTENVAGLNIGRKAAKDLNLGFAYGMGIPKLTAKLGTDKENATAVFRAYHKAVPYVKELGEECMRLAKRRGYIKTLLGRRSHFPDGEGAHKALNRAVQGSSADMLKKSLVDLDEAGFPIYGTVHDENDLPVEIGNTKYVEDIQEIMINTMKLEVPLVVDIEIGESWGEVEEWEKVKSSTTWTR